MSIVVVSPWEHKVFLEALPSSWSLEFHILHRMEETDGWYLNGIDYYLEGQSGLAYQDIKEAEGCIMQ